jgi:hypothetical protein
MPKTMEKDPPEVTAAVNYIKGYIKQHPAAFDKMGRNSNKAKEFNHKVVAKTARALVGPFSEAVGKSYAK